MSESVARQRPSVDLDDFQRRMQTQQHSHQQYAQHQYSHEEDPLAELARIVGDQPDPYGDVFAQQPVTQAELRASYEPYSQAPLSQARREPSLGAPPPRFSADFASIEAGLRAAAAPPTQPLAPDLHADPHAGYGYVPEARPQTYSQHAGPQQTEAPEIWNEPAKASRAGSRRPVYAMAASIAIAVVGIGVAFAYKGTGSSPREIKTIMAANGPTKVQPPADPGTATADQDAGMSQQPSTKLVSREEQPVDLAQAVQDNAAARGAPDASNVPVPSSPSQAAGTTSPDYSNLGGATPDTAGAGTASPAYGGDQAGFGVGMPQPKRVKSVSVTPDGRIVNEAAASDTEQTALAVKSSDRAGPVTGSPLFPTQAPKSATRAGKTATPHRVAEAKPADDNADEAPAPKPAKKAKPVKVASAETGAADTADNAATDQAKPAGGTGGFAVQLAAPGSESDARSATSKLLKKFSGALSGRRLGFRRADSNGHTVYRVRVSSLSKDEATSLCSKLKSDGGSCFVAKN